MLWGPGFRVLGVSGVSCFQSGLWVLLRDIRFRVLGFTVFASSSSSEENVFGAPKVQGSSFKVGHLGSRV